MLLQIYLILSNTHLHAIHVKNCPQQNQSRQGQNVIYVDCILEGLLGDPREKYSSGHHCMVSGVTSSVAAGCRWQTLVAPCQVLGRPHRRVIEFPSMICTSGTYIWNPCVPCWRSENSQGRVLLQSVSASEPYKHRQFTDPRIQPLTWWPHHRCAC